MIVRATHIASPIQELGQIEVPGKQKGIEQSFPYELVITNLAGRIPMETIGWR